MFDPKENVLEPKRIGTRLGDTGNLDPVQALRNEIRLDRITNPVSKIRGNSRFIPHFFRVGGEGERHRFRYR